MAALLLDKDRDSVQQEQQYILIPPFHRYATLAFHYPRELRKFLFAKKLI